MITHKNKAFLARYGSADTTKKVFDEGIREANLNKEHPHEWEFKMNPFTHEDVVRHIATHWNEDEFQDHPNYPKDLYEYQVDGNSGYGRHRLLQSHHLTLHHLKNMEAIRPLYSLDYGSLGKTRSNDPNIIPHVMEPHRLKNSKLTGSSINDFARNKNLTSEHLSNLIHIAMTNGEGYSPVITCQNIAKHPNLSKENANELRTKVDHAYINKLLADRGM